MRLYPCLIISREELIEAEVDFNESIGTEANVARVEDYSGKPVINIINIPNHDGAAAIIADGYVQFNPITKRRMTVLSGTFENLQAVLEEIFKRRSSENKMDVFESYSYQTSIDERLRLKNWVKQQCNS